MSQDSASSPPTPDERLRYRLQIDDWCGAWELAKQIEAGRAEQTPEVKALVDAVLYRGALNCGESEQAVVPFLRLQANTDSVQLLSEVAGGSLWTGDEARSLISPRLPPVFFDPVRADQELQRLIEFASQHQGTAPDGWRIYAAALAIAARRVEELQGQAWFPSIDHLASQADLRWWESAICAAVQVDRAELSVADEALGGLSTVNRRPVELATLAYLHARVRHQSANRPQMNVLLQWLSLTADWREKFPELAAAGLFHAAEIARQMEWLHEADRLTDELAFSYPQTFHGKIARNQ